DATAVTAPPFEAPSAAAVAAAKDLAADADATLTVGAEGSGGPDAVRGPNAEVAAAAGRVVPVAADADGADLLDAVAAATADGE
ncbi:corrinoid ABC transporter AT-binding protein, partial [Halorubrum sp. SS7]